MTRQGVWFWERAVGLWTCIHNENGSHSGAGSLASNVGDEDGSLCDGSRHKAAWVAFQAAVVCQRL